MTQALLIRLYRFSCQGRAMCRGSVYHQTAFFCRYNDTTPQMTLAVLTEALFCWHSCIYPAELPTQLYWLGVFFFIPLTTVAELSKLCTVDLATIDKIDKEWGKGGALVNLTLAPLTTRPSSGEGPHSPRLVGMI